MKSIRKNIRYGRKMSRFWCFCLILLGLNGALTAQTTVQVVTKKVEKSLPYTKDYLVSIDAEKAEITLKTDPNAKEVQVKMELIAKHPQLNTAKKDFEALKWVVDIIGKTIYCRNFVAIEKGADKPQSDLRVRYFIVVPPNAPVSIKNNFGKLNIHDLKNKLSIVTEFCKTELDNIEGQVAINAKFGNLVGSNVNAQLTIVSHRTEIDLKILRGGCDIKAEFGKIRVAADRLLTRLNVQAEKADVLLMPPPESNIAYDLSAEYGRVIVPKGTSLPYAERSKNREKIYVLPQNPKSAFHIQTSFGTIELGQ